MRQSQLFTKTLRRAPKEEVAVNAQLLIRAGYIDKLMTGVYSYLPLGLRVLKKVENIIREEMNKIGGQEVFLPALHPKEIWQKTNRWQYEEMFKVKNRQNKEFSLGWTHEEVITPLVKKFLNSYQDLPLAIYQIQDKFRDELRAKAGLLRGVEFIMKDLYSFHQNEKDLDSYYEKVKKAYGQVFKRCGLGKQTYLVLASGGPFSKYSHEFQTETPAGEDTIFLCEKCRLGINKEIVEEEKYRCPQCGNQNLVTKKTIEVGNIFKLKDKFSRPFNLVYKDRDGQEKAVLMGCYGIGLGRLIGTIVEIYHDQQGIVWPAEVAPYQIHLIPIGSSRKIKKITDKLYLDLQKEKIEVLYDDRENITAGEKLVEADLIGLPLRLVISEKTLERDCFEVKYRNKIKASLIKLKDLKKIINIICGRGY
ncbi:MAG: aminoacyl--tRNA ligase-related protein [Minisyncoccales bacterium]